MIYNTIYIRKLMKLLKNNGYKVRKTVVKLPEKFDDEQAKNRYQYTVYTASSKLNNVFIIVYSTQEFKNYNVFMDTLSFFDKISKCPISLPLPQNQSQENLLLDCIKSLETNNKKWDAISNKFLFDYWIKSYDTVSTILKKVKNTTQEEIDEKN